MTDKEMTPDTLPESTQEVQEPPQQEEPEGDILEQVLKEPVHVYHFPVELKDIESLHDINPEDITPEELEQWRERAQEGLQQLHISVTRLIEAIATISDNTGTSAELLKECARQLDILGDNIVESEKNKLIAFLQLFGGKSDGDSDGRDNEKLPLLQSITPSTHTMPNNALMNILQQKPAINAGPFDMVVSNAIGKRREITAYTIVTFDPGETDIKITDPQLTEYERQVSDAIVSLWVTAIKEKLPPVFTPDMIYRAMPGGSDKASPQQKGAITKAIEKFRRLHITVDATEEMRKRGIISSNATYTIDSFYLAATHAEYKVKNGGQTVNAYKIDAEPIILTYCKMTNQILTVPVKYIEIQKVKKGDASGELITMSADRQAMTGYMLRRIAVMKHDKRNKVHTQSNTILFETLFTETGTKTGDRKQTMLNRNFCFDVLEYWKITGYINGYTKQEKGRSVTGITIDL